MSPPSEYTKRLLVETNTKNAMHVGNVFMKAVVGYSRLLSLKTMQVGILFLKIDYALRVFHWMTDFCAFIVTYRINVRILIDGTKELFY